MGFLGGAIGAGLKIAGSIAGGIASRKAMKRVRGNLEAQRRENRDWYDRRYNEDSTQRAEAQAILTRTEESIRNRNRQAAGAQAVTGGSEESVAAAKAVNNQALSDAAAQIAANGERRKDAIESQYQAKDDALQQQLNDLDMGHASQVGHATSGVLETGANIAGIL